MVTQAPIIPHLSTNGSSANGFDAEGDLEKLMM